MDISKINLDIYKVNLFVCLATTNLQKFCKATKKSFTSHSTYYQAEITVHQLVVDPRKDSFVEVLAEPDDMWPQQAATARSFTPTVRPSKPTTQHVADGYSIGKLSPMQCIQVASQSTSTTYLGSWLTGIRASTASRLGSLKCNSKWGWLSKLSKIRIFECLKCNIGQS